MLNQDKENGQARLQTRFEDLLTYKTADDTGNGQYSIEKDNQRSMQGKDMKHYYRQHQRSTEYLHTGLQQKKKQSISKEKILRDQPHKTSIKPRTFYQSVKDRKR